MNHRILQKVWWLSLMCWWVGCQSRPTEPNPELADAGKAARARFDEQQAEHRHIRTPAQFELLPFTRSEHREDGIVYAESVEFLRLPIAP